MIDGDALTAWLILKAPVLVALIYLVLAIRGNQQAILITIFFFPFVFLLIKNLWLEVVHDELLKKLKIESGLEIELNKKLLRISRLSIVVLSIVQLFLFPKALDLYGKSGWAQVALILPVAVVLIITIGIFLLQLQFTFHIGKLILVLETNRKYNPYKEKNRKHRLEMINPVSFRKYHDRIKSIFKKM